MTVLLLSIFVPLCAVAFGVFVYWERMGRPATVIAFLVGLLVIESALYSSPNEVSLGLLHPQIGSLSFRVFDVLVPLAFIARLVGRRKPVAPHPAVQWWLPFGAWMFAAGCLGALVGNAFSLVTFEAKLLIYLLMVPLGAGVPARQYLESRAVRRVLTGSALLATVLTGTNLAHVSVSWSFQLLPLQELGTLGSDLASVFVTLGVVTLAVSLASEQHRAGAALLALPLLVCPLAVGQRAAIVGLVVSLAALTVAIPFGRKRLRTTPTEVALVLATGLCLVVLPTAAPAISQASPGSLPFANVVNEAFTGREKQLSGEDRVYQWQKARGLIAKRPVYGYGLGYQYVSWDPGYFVFRQNFLTHNIVGDLLLRMGVVGLLLFCIPVGIAVAIALRCWRALGDPRLAAIALGSAAAVTGLLAKGLFESIFEKYRLSIMLALLIGVIVAMHREVRAPVPVPMRMRTVEGSA
jgi:O-antigen ligase